MVRRGAGDWSGSSGPARLAVVAAWVVSRAALMVGLNVVQTTMVLGDVTLYRHWVAGMTAGHGLPVHDERWQYPPGAAAVLLIAELAPRYLWGLFTVIFVADLAVLATLLRRGQRPEGAMVWVVGPTLLGPITYARFDIVPTAFAVCGLMWARRPTLAGAAFALGGWIKVWPALLLGALRNRRTVLTAGLGAAAASVGVIGVLAATGQFDAVTAFARFQQARGLQVEAVMATPFLVARAFGIGPAPVYRYGAMEVTAAGADVAAALCTAGEILVLGIFAAVAVRRLRRRAPANAPEVDVALALVLGLMVTSRVLSPQYLLWALGLAAAALATGSRQQRTTAGLLVVAAAASQLVYPLLYGAVLAGSPVAAGVLVLRNLLLIAATASAVRGARRRAVATQPASALVTA